MTTKLNLQSNLSDYDDVYQMIIDMHQELSDEESQSANAKLILILANHIGDSAVIAEAVQIARTNTLVWRESENS